MPSFKCVVCASISNGFHFGVISCAACSAFFRRSVVESRRYRCRKNSQCVIDGSARCFCRACRFEKCLRVGMDPNAVQPHRDSIGKIRRNPNVNGSEVRQPKKEVNHHGVLCSDESRTPQSGQESSVLLNLSRPTKTSNKVGRENCATAQLLMSTGAVAEQLLAFSRGSLISKQEMVANESLKSKASSFSESNVDIEDQDSPLLSPPHSILHMPTEQPSVDCIPSSTIYYEAMYPCATFVANEAGNLIEHLVSCYKALRERRRLLHCPPTIRDILGSSEPPMRPARFCASTCLQLRIELAFIVEFFNCIHPFSKLRLEDRVLLVKNSLLPYSVLEKHYVTMLGGGYQTNRIINVDNTYFDLSESLTSSSSEGSKPSAPADPTISSDVETSPKNFEGLASPSRLWIPGCCNTSKTENIDQNTLKRLLFPTLRESLRAITGAMYHFGMTDAEFVALVVIILFDSC
ncbi:hypothetical protein AB6A40_009395 [Gnathostoma spinigerum]|uniref:Uncharacterized protein n=1 Tax=Gnathostoma spinigerum TaxID=75299 RepID=A0ABD6ES59_9BILA